MKNLKDIITEKLRLDKDIKGHQYTCQPQGWTELRNIIKKRLEQDNDADLNDIDISKITGIDWLFCDLDPYDIKIDKWDVSNVKNMTGTFYNCKNVNTDIGNWDVSNVTDMRSMFKGCKKFEGNGLENWDVSKVENMTSMFYGCYSLKKTPTWCI